MMQMLHASNQSCCTQSLCAAALCAAMVCAVSLNHMITVVGNERTSSTRAQHCQYPCSQCSRLRRGQRRQQHAATAVQHRLVVKHDWPRGARSQ
jgi:hypothetical protein